MSSTFITSLMQDSLLQVINLGFCHLLLRDSSHLKATPNSDRFGCVFIAREQNNHLDLIPLE
jgi:hypothetical protein